MQAGNSWSYYRCRKEPAVVETFYRTHSVICLSSFLCRFGFFSFFHDHISIRGDFKHAVVRRGHQDILLVLMESLQLLWSRSFAAWCPINSTQTNLREPFSRLIFIFKSNGFTISSLQTWYSLSKSLVLSRVHCAIQWCEHSQQATIGELLPASGSRTLVKITVAERRKGEVLVDHGEGG